MKFKVFVFLLVIPFVLYSCKGKHKKNQNVDNSVNKENITDGVDQTSPLFTLARDIYMSQDTFSTVEIKFDLKLQLPERNVSGSGTLRIANDSLMWFYIKALGFEIARAKLTKDSVFAVIKIKNQYFKGDYSLLKQFFPIEFDFSILQSVFLNKFFLFPENKVEYLKYFLVAENNCLLKLNSIKSYNDRYGLSDEILISRESSRVTKNSAIVQQSNKGVSITYGELKDFSLHKLPQEVTFQGIGTDFNVSFNYTKVVFAKKLQYPLTIPNGYKELTID